MDYPIQPLYRLLQFWHLFSILARVAGIAKKSMSDSFTANENIYQDAIAKHADYEKYLLNVHKPDFDPNAFIGVKDMDKLDWNNNPDAGLYRNWTIMSIPGMIASWTQQSRRVYTIPEDLQLLLANTSLIGVDWKKVRFPFDSFLLNLPVPIEGSDGASYDAILISKDSPRWGEMVQEEWGEDFKSSPMLSVTIVPTRLKSPSTDLPIIKQQQLLKLAHGANPPKALDAMCSVLYAGKPMFPLMMMNFPIDGFSHPEFIETVDTGRTCSLNALVGRIMFGFILYLQNTPRNTTHADKVEHHPSSKIPGQGKVLADAAMVCHVQSIYKLDAEEKTVFRNVMMGKGGYEVSTHHREGHWRRPPGKGHDPTADKTVWIRPTIVRRDRLQEGTLPKGTEKVVA